MMSRKNGIKRSHKMTLNPIFHSCYIKAIYEEEQHIKKCNLYIKLVLPYKCKPNFVKMNLLYLRLLELLLHQSLLWKKDL